MNERKRHIEEEVDGKGSHTRIINQRAAKLVKLNHNTNTGSSDNFVDLTRQSLSGIREEPFDDSYDGYGIELDFVGTDQGHYSRVPFQVDITTEEVEVEVDVEVEAEIVDNKLFRCCADCNIEKHPSSFGRKQRSLLSDAVCRACCLIKRTCFGCGRDLTRYQFSNDQKKKGAAARCMKCIKNNSMKQAEVKKINKNRNRNRREKVLAELQQQQRLDCAKCGDRFNLFSRNQRNKGAAARCMECIKSSMKQAKEKKNYNNKNKNSKALAEQEQKPQPQPQQQQQQRLDCATCGDRSNLFSKQQRKNMFAAAICMNCQRYPPKKQEDGKEQKNNKNDLNELSQSLPSLSTDMGLGRGMHMTRPAWMKEQQHQRPDHQHQQKVIESLRPGANNCDGTDDGLGRGRGAHMTRPAWMTVQDDWQHEQLQHHPAGVGPLNMSSWNLSCDNNAGRGRGRGIHMTKPAWMMATQNNQQLGNERNENYKSTPLPNGLA